MPRDLFGELQHPPSASTRSRYTVPVSLAAHLAALALLVAGALVAPAVLPAPAAGELILLASVPVPAPPPVRRAAEPVEPRVVANPNAAPTAVPDGIAPEPDFDFSLPEGAADATGILVGVEGFETVVGEPPAPPPAPQAPVPVGGNVKAPSKLRDAAPVYPSIAQAARVQGVVIIEATIGTDGRVTAARVLRSIPLLDEAALAAVRQWIYTPTLLNGVPVPVLMTVTVVFTLQ